MSRVPLLFVSHGAPTVALEESDYTRALAAFGKTLRPSAVVVVSAHWEERQPVRVGSAMRHETLHDFGGFPAELYQLQYPAPGSPELAARIASALEEAGIPARLDPARPLDHGAWVPLRFLFPRADIPVLEVTLPRPREPRLLARIGGVLSPLRDAGVLLVGSGGAVHNLARISFDARRAPPEPWALDFDAWLAGRLSDLDFEGLYEWKRLAPKPEVAHPTTEHMDPVFIVAGAAAPPDRAETLHEGFEYGNLSMRTVVLG